MNTQIKDYKALGELPYENKQVLWHKYLSGSKMRSLMENPMALLTTMLSNIEPVFNDRQKAKMRAGTELEEYIRTRFLEECTDRDKQDGTKDKQTYMKEVGKYAFSANIDGYRLEIKNTEGTDIDKLSEYYYPQLQYYMWFFNEDYWWFVPFMSGWKLEYKKVMRDDAFIEKMMTLALEFCEALEAKDADHIFTNWTSPVTDTQELLLDSMLSEDAKLIDDYVHKSLQEKQLEAELTDLKETILARFGENPTKILHPSGSLTLLSISKQGSIDYKEVLKQFDTSKLNLDNYRKDPTYYQTCTFRANKTAPVVDTSDINIDDFI